MEIYNMDFRQMKKKIQYVLYDVRMEIKEDLVELII